jgi:hypothetical protein
MGDRFLGVTGDLDDPGLDAFAVTPSSSALTYTARALYIGSVGDVQVVTASGSTVTFTAVPTGTILPIRCTKVLSGATTAGSIVAIT